MKNLFLKLIPDAFKQGLKIKLGAPHMYWSIRNLKRNGLDATSIIDIGAYEGGWTEDVLKIFPDANYLLIEANPEKDAKLKAFARQHPRAKITHEIALLDSQTSTGKKFHLKETGSSAIDEHTQDDSKTVLLPTKRLDDLAKRHGFEKVSLLKVDVQGYELQVLKGAGQLLADTETALLEVSLLEINKGAPLMREVINFMYDHQFVVYDICSITTRRPLDMALWQTDLLFVKEHSVFRQNKGYY